MATVTRVNPASEAVDFNNTGRNLVHLDIDFNGAVNGKLGPNSTVKAVLEAISQTNNIVLAGPLHTTNNNMSIAVEGDLGEDTYDGTNSETLAAHLEDVVQALGTVDGIGLGSATVTAKTYVL